MDEEKMQRHVEFLLEWQAQFSAKLGELGEKNKQNTENIERLSVVVERVVGVVERFAQVTAERFEAVDRRADEFDRKLAALVDAQIQNEEMVGRLGERIDRLAATVERHTADGHGGKEQPES